MTGEHACMQHVPTNGVKEFAAWAYHGKDLSPLTLQYAGVLLRLSFCGHEARVVEPRLERLMGELGYNQGWARDNQTLRKPALTKGSQHLLLGPNLVQLSGFGLLGAMANSSCAVEDPVKDEVGRG